MEIEISQFSGRNVGVCVSVIDLCVMIRNRSKASGCVKGFSNAVNYDIIYPNNPNKNNDKFTTTSCKCACFLIIIEIHNENTAHYTRTISTYIYTNCMCDTRTHFGFMEDERESHTNTKCEKAFRMREENKKKRRRKENKERKCDFLDLLNDTPNEQFNSFCSKDCTQAIASSDVTMLISLVPSIRWPYKAPRLSCIEQ